MSEERRRVVTREELNEYIDARVEYWRETWRRQAAKGRDDQQRIDAAKDGEWVYVTRSDAAGPVKQETQGQRMTDAGKQWLCGVGLVASMVAVFFDATMVAGLVCYGLLTAYVAYKAWGE